MNEPRIFIKQEAYQVMKKIKKQFIVILKTSFDD